MTSGHNLEITPQAENDIRSTLQHTVQTWGERQQSEYATIISTALRDIASFPVLGRMRRDLPGDVRSLAVREQVVNYEMDDNTVTILRVLHAKMDAARHLAT